MSTYNLSLEMSDPQYENVEILISTQIDEDGDDMEPDEKLVTFKISDNEKDFVLYFSEHHAKIVAQALLAAIEDL